MKRLIPVVCCLLLSGQALAEIKQLSYSGHAYEVPSNRLVFIENYLETYSSSDQLLKSEVRYLSESNELLAKKQLNYREQSYAPAFHYRNVKTGYSESLIWLGADEVLMSHTEPGQSKQQKIIKLSFDSDQPYVADAGFDAFIRSHLDRLARGQTLEFRFLNPSRLDWFRFQAILLDQKESHILIEVSPKNRILRLLVEPIFLSYAIDKADTSSQRLMQYSGLTNMSLNNKDYIKANIVYQYEQPTKTLANLF